MRRSTIASPPRPAAGIWQGIRGVRVRMEPRSGLARVERIVRQVAVAGIVAYPRLVPRRWERNCLMDPHCSEYGLLAITKWGVLSAARETFARIRRCRPGVL